MQTLSRPSSAKPSKRLSNYRAPRGRKRFSPMMFIGLIVMLVIVLGIGGYVVIQKLTGTHAATANPDCTLIAPANPLSAKGLATPWQLVATNPANGACAQASMGAFVQGAVFNPADGQISIYNPLVIDQGTQPAIAPTAPTLPKGAVVGLWFGDNGMNLTLQGATANALAQGKCVNGTQGSIFGQFAYCNAPAFFAAANQAIQQGQLQVPALGTGKDGLPCPTVSSFAVVDMDPHDNVTTTYLVNGQGQTAQMTAANVQALQGAQPQVNGSDERLVSVALAGALGCTPWQAPDLADNGNMVPALPLNELQAAVLQTAPRAGIPATDPMTLVNAQPNLQKLNLYRAGVNEAPVQSLNQVPTKTFCMNMLKLAPARIMRDAALTQQRPSPDPAAANSLFTFLAQRFVGAYGADGLNCQALTGVADTISVQTNGNGVAISANINGAAINGGAPDCVVNGTTIGGCAGATTINGQNCTFAAANNVVTVTCAAAAAVCNNGTACNNNGTAACNNGTACNNNGAAACNNGTACNNNGATACNNNNAAACPAAGDPYANATPPPNN